MHAKPREEKSLIKIPYQNHGYQLGSKRKRMSWLKQAFTKYTKKPFMQNIKLEIEKENHLTKLKMYNKRK